MTNMFVSNTEALSGSMLLLLIKVHWLLKQGLGNFVFYKIGYKLYIIECTLIRNILSFKSF